MKVKTRCVQLTDKKDFIHSNRLYYYYSREVPRKTCISSSKGSQIGMVVFSVLRVNNMCRSRVEVCVWIMLLLFFYRWTLGVMSVDLCFIYFFFEEGQFLFITLFLFLVRNLMSREQNKWSICQESVKVFFDQWKLRHIKMSCILVHWSE